MNDGAINLGKVHLFLKYCSFILKQWTSDVQKRAGLNMIAGFSLTAGPAAHRSSSPYPRQGSVESLDRGGVRLAAAMV